MMDIEGNLVQGWQIRHSMGMAVLAFGVDAVGPNGESGVVLTPHYLLTERHCRDLAAQLSQAADILKTKTGSA